MTDSKKISWTEVEDKICCQAFLEEYVFLKKDTDVEKVLDDIKDYENFIERDRSSIRMRLQNIKALVEELHIQNTARITPLNNAASQTRRILQEELKKMTEGKSR